MILCCITCFLGFLYFCACLHLLNFNIFFLQNRKKSYLCRNNYNEMRNCRIGKRFNVINLLCALIIVILTGSIAMNLFVGIESFVYGFQAGYKAADEGLDGDKNPVNVTIFDVAFNPDTSRIYSTTDSITFQDGNRYPLVMTRGMITVPDKRVDPASSIVRLIVNLASIALFIALIVELIKFVIVINKGRYFEIKNLRRLQRFGVYLLVLAFLECVGGICDDIIFSTLNLKLDGYLLSTYWSIPWGNALMGLLALMLAQIWKKGIYLKEEQELTI